MKNVTIVLIMSLLVISMILNESVIFASENKVTLSTQKPLESPAGKFLYLVYTEAFKRLDIVFVYETLPAKRSSYWSDRGRVDGELSRIYSYSEVHPNVIRVEEPHWTSGFIAATTDSSTHLNGWDSLKNTDYKVNYMRGIKGCEINLPKVVKPENLEIVVLTKHGFNKVLSGRADIFIGAEMDIVSVLESNEFINSNLRICGVMETFTAHAFLHKKHKGLVLKLSDVLKKMKEEGLFKKYREASKLKTYFKD